MYLQRTRALVLFLAVLSSAMPPCLSAPGDNQPAETGSVGSETISDGRGIAAEEVYQAVEPDQAGAGDAGAARGIEMPVSTPDAARQDVEADSGFSRVEALNHYEIGHFYFMNWKLHLAQVELEQAIANWPGLKLAHRDLCLVALLKGRLLYALAQFMIVTGIGDAVPFTSPERAALNHKTFLAHYNQGVKDGLKRRWQNAVSEFQWSLTYAPTSAIVHRSLGFAYSNLGDFDRAEKEYSLALNLNPGDAYARADYAFLLADGGKQGRAFKEMSEAVRLKPAVTALHVDLGWMAEARGDFETAGDEFRKAVELSPGHPGLWLHLGKILEEQGKESEAIAAYSRALALNPAQAEARNRLKQLKEQTLRSLPDDTVRQGS